MNFPFKFSVSYSGTPVVKKVFDNTDNLVLANIISAAISGKSLSDLAIVSPTTAHWLTSFRLESSAACTVEIGLFDGGSNFIALYPDVSTEATAGGVVRMLEQSSPLFAQDGATWFTALRVTGDSNGTIIVTGDLGVAPR